MKKITLLIIIISLFFSINTVVDAQISSDTVIIEPENFYHITFNATNAISIRASSNNTIELLIMENNNYSNWLESKQNIEYKRYINTEFNVEYKISKNSTLHIIFFNYDYYTNITYTIDFVSNNSDLDYAYMVPIISIILLSTISTKKRNN